MLVGRRIDEQASGLQQHILEGARNREQEEDFDLLGHVECRDYGFGRGMAQPKTIGEGDELFVIADILANPIVVATYIPN